MTPVRHAYPLEQEIYTNLYLFRKEDSVMANSMTLLRQLYNDFLNNK